MKRIVYSKASQKALSRMPANTHRLIEAKIEKYAEDPSSLANNVTSLKGASGYSRLRIGDWRVIFTEVDETLEIVDIAARQRLRPNLRSVAIMGVQVITTPSGERLVVIPEAEYDALIEAAEDAADSEVVRRFRAALAAGEEELIPAEFVDRFLAGESPVRVWREFRGLSVEETAARVGINEERLAEIEGRIRPVEGEMLQTLADVLRVDPEDLTLVVNQD